MPSRPDTARARDGRAEAEAWRVGLLVPSSNSVLEPALWRRLPEGTTLHAARLFVTESSAASVQGIHDAIPEAARLLGTVRPHLLVVGCTSVSGVEGGHLEAELVPAIARVTGAPVITVPPAVIRWLRAARCDRVVLVTPHGADVDALVIRGLEDAGIRLRRVYSMGIQDNFELGRVPPSDIVRFVVERVGALGSDALFLSCTNFRSVEVLPALRRRYGPRVVSSVGVLIDQTLAELGRLRRRAAAAASGVTLHERGRHGA